jgi:two-component system cell cycle response regulator DivK
MKTRHGAAAVESHAPADAERKTVLVVEDNDLNLKLFQDLLTVHGYRVLAARDGSDGVELARRHRPDLILMDIQLPGISGLVAAKMIREDDALKATPIVAVTAFALKGDEKKIRESGCDDCIPKPISAPNFLKTVKQYLS